MTIEVDLSAETFRRFCIFDTLKRRKMWRNPAIFALILLGCAVLCLAKEQGRVLGIVLAVVGLGMPCVYFASFFLSVNQQIRKQGMTRPLRAYTLTMEECDKLIHIANEKEHVDYPWKKVHHAYRDSLATYLYVTPRQAFILPHTCVEPEALWDLIEKKLPQEKRSVL